MDRAAELQGAPGWLVGEGRVPLPDHVGLAHGAVTHVVVPVAEGEGILLIGGQGTAAQHGDGNHDLEVPAAGDGAGDGREAGDGDALVGDAAVDAEGELVGAAGGGDVEAQLEVVVLPDVGAVVADGHVIPDGDAEVEAFGGPGGAQAEAEVGGGGHVADDGGGVAVVEEGGVETAPLLEVAVDDRPDARAQGFHRLPALAYLGHENVVASVVRSVIRAG